MARLNVTLAPSVGERQSWIVLSTKTKEEIHEALVEWCNDAFGNTLCSIEYGYSTGDDYILTEDIGSRFKGIISV